MKLDAKPKTEERRAHTMDYELIQLLDIDFTKLALVKESTSRINGQDHSRWVFRGDYRKPESSPRRIYLKIWNPQHVRRDNILRALDAGFYDESTIPALMALIFHKGVCRGYITEECDMPYRTDTKFFQTIKHKTVQCEYFAIQFSRYHVGLCKGQYSLIDLEGVHPISDLPKMESLASFFDDHDYGQFVTSQYLALYPGKQEGLGNYTFLPKACWKTYLTKVVDAFYPTMQFKMWRSKTLQRRIIKRRPTHTHLIEY